ncbi:MAG: hypothetical protein SFW08_06320 [Gemmatimonadaceae bacterium]|nr:hypothetical protein [Gemmatimonadaceae bacterium]
MHVGLLESLRCPAPHAASPLIAAVRQQSGRDVLEATLGCPVCHREVTVHRGVVTFGDVAPAAEAVIPTDDAALMRLGALLGLTTPGGTVAVSAAWSDLARPLAVLTDVRVLVVGPPPGFLGDEDVGVLEGVRDLPLSPGSCRGVALGSSSAEAPSVVASWVRAVRVGGRVVAPATLPVPEGLRELARDDAQWVAERLADTSSAPVALTRAGAASRGQS